MRQIRRGVFETNSSSVHSMTLMHTRDFEKWCNSNLYAHFGSNGEVTFATREELAQRLEMHPHEDEFLETVADLGWYTWETYGWDNEVGWVSMTTEHGDDVTVVGYFGYDG